MNPQELRSWFKEKETLRFKEKKTDLLFDVMWSKDERDLVALHQCNDTDQVWVLSLEEFCEQFEEPLSSQPD